MSFQGHHSTYAKCTYIDINYFLSWHILQHASKNNQSTHADENYTYFIRNQICLGPFVLSKRLTVSRVLPLMFNLHFHFHQYILNFSLFKTYIKTFIFYSIYIYIYIYIFCPKLLSLLLIYVCSTNIFKFQFQCFLLLF